MFHTGTVNPNQKMTAENMHEELLECVEYGELEEEIPKISTIANWITRTYACWKKQMAEKHWTSHKFNFCSNKTYFTNFWSNKNV